MTKKDNPTREDEVLLRMLKTPPKLHALEKHPRAKEPNQSRPKAASRKPKKSA